VKSITLAEMKRTVIEKIRPYGSITKFMATGTEGEEKNTHSRM